LGTPHEHFESATSSHVLLQITAKGAMMPSATLDELVDGGRAAKHAWLAAVQADRQAQEAAQGWGQLNYKPRKSPHMQVCLLLMMHD
jgi:hypothetical protein